MSKVVFTSDLHLHAHNNRPDRLADGLSALRQTLTFARTHRCPWIGGGDFKIPYSTWPVPALTGALALFQEFKDLDLTLVKGNHDGDSEHGSGLRPFQGLAQIVERPTRLEVAGESVVVYPATPDPIDPDVLGSLGAGKARILIAHAFLHGALVGPEEMRAPGVGESLDVFGFLGKRPRFLLGLFGDIHKGQVLLRRATRIPAWVSYADLLAGGKKSLRDPAPWQGEIFYPGSPYQQNWGERNDGPKGALLVDLASGAVELLPVEGPRHIELTWPDPPWGFPEVGAQVSVWKGQFVRLLVGGWAEDPRARAVLERMQETCGARTFQVIPLPEETQSDQRADLHAGMSGKALLSAYIAARPLKDYKPKDLLAAGETLFTGRP